MPTELRLTKTEYAVVLWPGDEPEPPLYDDCAEACAVVAFAGAGVVAVKAYYETDWMAHEPHV